MKSETNPELLVAVTGAVWKCAINEENVVYLHNLRTIDQLVNLLTNSSENVLVNVVGAIAELSYDPMSRLCIRQSGGIPFLINLLNGWRWHVHIAHVRVPYTVYVLRTLYGV